MLTLSFILWAGGLSASLLPSISALLLFLHPVIGRGGEQINKIQQDSGCKVQISPGRSARAGWGWVPLLGLLARSLMTPGHPDGMEVKRAGVTALVLCAAFAQCVKV